MIPSDVSFLEALGRSLVYVPSKEKKENMERNKGTRAWPVCKAEAAVGDNGSAMKKLAILKHQRNETVLPDTVGMALSFALRLKKRKSGVNHTHIAKNEAISAKPGTCVFPALYALVCLTSLVMRAK